MSGLFISFEGTEESGQSTQVSLLAEHLRFEGYTVRTIREPGGTPNGEEIRHTLKHSADNEAMTAETELLLMNASRAQLVREVIRPALADGEIVIYDRIPAWEVFICHVLKWSVVLVLVGGTIFFALVIFMPYLPSYRSARSIPLAATILWSTLFVGLASACAWYGWRVAKEPIAKVRKRTPIGRLSAEYRAAFTSEQLEMYEKMAKLFQAREFAQSEALLDRLMPAISDHNSDGYVQLLLVKLNCLLGQNQIERMEALCLDYTQQDAGKEQKIKVLDGIASYILYQSSSALLGQGERFARMGLEIAPGTLTLKGTLGSILAEQAKYGEAEQLLLECLERSVALHDRAISTFYLGMIKLRTGKTKEGQRLVKRGMKMYPEPWLVGKGDTLLKEGARSGRA